MVGARSLLIGLALLVMLIGIPPVRTLAGGPAPSGATNCPSRTACDRALGIALTPPANWRMLPPGKLPPHTIGLYAPPVTGFSYNVRLIISSDGTTRQRNDGLAAARAAQALLRGYRRIHMRPPLVRIPVRYGGAPGVMILNLPGQPQLLVEIVLAHAGVLYHILAPGQSSLAPDQRSALASLRFIRRVGPFPSANPPAVQITHQSRTPSRGLPRPILAGVATDLVGHVYVADLQTGRLFVLSRDLTLRGVWIVPRPPGPADVHLTGVAVGRQGAVYVSDQGTDTVHKLSPTGRGLAVWGSPGMGPGKFRGPNGIAVGARGNVLVADGYNHRIQKLSPGGKPLSQWQLYPRQDSPGGPCGLESLALNARGQAFVTDDCYQRVLKVSPSGKVLQAWGKAGSGLGQFAFAGMAGVAVGPGGSVFIAGNSRIQKFSPGGKLLHVFLRKRRPIHPFSPTGIAVDAQGNMYVADAENGRLLKLSPSGKTLATRCLGLSICRQD
jgi:DNA-binding beta-propeller fold protein YncE